MASFSSPSELPIHRSIDVQQQSLATSDSLLESYEIHRSVEIIKQHNFKRITLQFPDELLHESVSVYQSLKSQLGTDAEIYVLADTTYGSCCVDEVAAQHVDADVVIHYGHACLSVTSRLPVIYVFGKRPVNAEHCINSLFSTLQPTHSDVKRILLLHDVSHTYQMDAVLAHLGSAKPDVTVHYTPKPQGLVQPRTQQEPHDPPSPPTQLRNNFPPDVDTTDSLIYYIGCESLALSNILLSHSTIPVYSYDPSTKTAKFESGRSNRLLMRRYAIMQKARDADVFGILAGTLGVASYLPLISHLRTRIAKARRKSYTLSVGKLNPAKLANFPEIECFIMVACPENSIVESKEFSAPIITPYELELALQPESTWTGKLSLDFDEVIAEQLAQLSKPDTKANEENGEDDDRPSFSLVTGTYRSRKYYSAELPSNESITEPNVEGSQAVTLRNKNTAVGLHYTHPIGEYLKNRTFKGLETRVGMDSPSILEQGRTGIARGYGDDHIPESTDSSNPTNK